VFLASIQSGVLVLLGGALRSVGSTLVELVSTSPCLFSWLWLAPPVGAAGCWRTLITTMYKTIPVGLVFTLSLGSVFICRSGWWRSTSGWAGRKCYRYTSSA